MADFVRGYEVDENNASSHMAATGRERAKAIYKLEKKSIAVVYASKQLRSDIGMAKTTKKPKLLQLMRDLINHLDRLRESHTKLRRGVAMDGRARRIPAERFMISDRNPNLHWSALGRGPRAHLGVLTDTSKRNVE